MRVLLGLLLLLRATAWGANSTTYLWVPDTGFPGVTDNTNTPVHSANVMICADFSPSLGITNATKIQVMNVTAQTTGNTGACLYTAGGAALLATTGAFTCAGAFTKCGVTGLTPFTLNTMATYRLCYTSDNASIQFLAGGRVDPTLNNAFVNHTGTAANPGVAGVCPATTGALTGVSENFIDVLLSVE